MKKWLKILIIILSSIVLLLALVLLLVSPIAKSYVNKHGKELIGREIHVEKLRVNALAGRVRIYDLAVYEEDDTTRFFHFDTLDVSVKLRKLLGNELYVRHITLAGPKVRVIQNGNRFNFTSIIDHFASDEPKEKDTTSSNWSLGFYNIRLSEGEIYYADNKLASEWDLKNLNIKIPGVYFDGSENTDAGIALQLADGGTLRTEASINMDNNEFDVKLWLEKFAISNVKAYLADVMNVGKMDGMLDASLSAKGNLSDIMKMVISGNVAIGGVDIRDTKNNQVVALNKLAVNVNGINLDENFYDIKSVTLAGLESHFDRYKDGSNFSKLFSTKGKSEPSTEETTEQDVKETQKQSSKDDTKKVSKPMKLKVGKFAVEDAQFTFNDYTLPDAFSFPVKKLNITADNISTSGDNNAKLFAQLPHGGVAMIKWHGNIDNWKQNQSLILNIKNLQLKDLSPYSVAYLGCPFTDGTFSFTSENNIRFSQLDGRNKIDLFNPEVGDKRSDVEPQVKIPLKAALFILKDKDDRVELDVPVAGNIDSPEFSYMKIVWKTLGNLIVKVATSPFRAAGKALGLSGDLDFIAYNPLQTSFSSEQYNTFNKIVDVLQYDTSIMITLVPQLDMEKAWHQQSLYLLKEEFFLARHPEKAPANILPQAVIYDQVNAIASKDTAFVRYLQRKGLQSRRPSDKEIQRFAETHYPKDAAMASLEVLAGMRDQFVRRFFSEQGIQTTRLAIAPLEKGVQSSGYTINSEYEDEYVEEEEQ
ncbi:MAG: DUF748 domain-containing protein [Bacteroidales bacterium]|nr:DUF748 domain-containing protein [Bacteroidales bacterium]